MTFRRLAPAAGLALILCAVRLAGQTPMTVEVDARDAPRRILHARLRIPAAAGPLTLLYPEWLPGEHGPTGPIADLAGLRFSAGGKTLVWKRDPVDMYAFHLDVPAGASGVEVALDFLAPAATRGLHVGPLDHRGARPGQLESARPLPEVRCSRRSRLRREPPAPRGLEIRNGPRDGARGARRHRLRARVAHDARRFAGARGRALPDGHARRRPDPSPAPHRRRRRGGACDAAGGGARLQEPRRRDRRALRRAALPAL